MPARVLEIFSGSTTHSSDGSEHVSSSREEDMDHGLDTLHHGQEGFCQLCHHQQDLGPNFCFGPLLETKMDRNGLVGVALQGVLVVGV